MLPWSIDFRGRFDEIVFESEVLKGNRLGDPHHRPLWVYLPPGYDDEPERWYSTIYLIQGLTGQLDMWRNRPPLRKNFPELADELFAKGEAPPCILVWVDCWTSLGGSQFLDSPATGRYHTYLCEEIVPWIDSQYRTLPIRDHRATPGSQVADTERWSRPCSGRIFGEVLPPTLAMPSLRHAISPTSGHRFGRFEIITRAPSRNSGGTFETVRPSPRRVTHIF